VAISYTISRGAARVGDVDRAGRCRGGALAAAAVGRSHSGDQWAPFVLIRLPRGGDVRKELRRRGFAARRGDTFPGLDPDWLRITVRDPATSGAFARSPREVLT